MRRQASFPDAAKTIGAVLAKDDAETSSIYRAVFAAKAFGVTGMMA